METLQILEAIKRLPLREKMHIVELIFKDIREETISSEQEVEKRKRAAELLLFDYKSDEELTAFTVLDKEDFHEKS